MMKVVMRAKKKIAINRDVDSFKDVIQRPQRKLFVVLQMR